MELVRHTIEFIKRKPYGNKLLVKAKDEVKLVINATPGYEPYDRQKIIEQNKKNTVRHAYFREYLALQRLCLLILQHQRHQIGLGVKRIYGNNRRRKMSEYGVMLAEKQKAKYTKCRVK